MVDETDDIDPDQARQQRMAAMLGIMSGNPGLGNFGAHYINDQNTQQKNQLDSMHDAIAQSLQLAGLNQSAQQHADSLAEAIREHDMVDLRSREEHNQSIQARKSQQADLDSAQPVIDSIGQYKSPMPTSRSAYGQMIADEVAKQYPNYDATIYNERKAAQVGFASGKQGDLLRSADTSIQHLDTADKLSAQLGNTQYPVLNMGINAWKNFTGSPDIKAFNAARDIVSGEVNKFIVGGHAAEGDRERLIAQLNVANSPEQLTAVTNTLRQLMAGQVEALKGQYVGAQLGSEQDFYKKLDPRTIGALGLADAQHGAAPGGAGATPGTGSGPPGGAIPGGSVGSTGSGLGAPQGAAPLRIKVDAQGNVIGN
jgi:hypothetical protein